MSREEREAKYAQVRERIFGKSTESNGDATPGMLTRIYYLHLLTKN
jgi:hypothetical protein